jgi:hypothetical protein
VGIASEELTLGGYCKRGANRVGIASEELTGVGIASEELSWGGYCKEEFSS